MATQVRWTAMAAIVGAVLILILAAFFLHPTSPLNLDGALRALAAASGVGTGMLYIALGRELRLTRLQWVGLCGGLLCAALFFLPMAAAPSFLALGGIRALTLFFPGGVTLRRRLAEVRARHG